MSIVRELITKLSFQVDNSKLAAYQANIAKLKTMQSGGGLGFGSDAISQRMSKMQAYQSEIKSLSMAERQDTLMLNRLEKTAAREVMAENKAKFTAEHNHIKLLEQAERRKAALAKRSVFSARASFNSLNTMVNRVSGTILLGTGGVLAKTMRDYKTYKDELKNGKTPTVFFSKEQLIKLTLFNNEFNKFKRTSSDITHQLFSNLSPVLVDLFKKFNGWYSLNKNEINGKLAKYATDIGDAFKEIADAMSWVSDKTKPLTGDFLNLKTIILGVVGIKFASWIFNVGGALFNFGIAIKSVASWATMLFPRIATSIASMRVAKFGLLGIAAGLLIDEITVTMAGGDSLINRFANSQAWGSISEKLASLTKGFRLLGNSILTAFEIAGVKAKSPQSQNKASEWSSISQKAVPIYSQAAQLASSSVMSGGNNSKKSLSVKQTIGDINITLHAAEGTNSMMMRDMAEIVKKEITEKLSDVMTMAQMNLSY